MTNFERMMDNPFTCIAIVLAAGIIGFSVAFLVAMI